MRTCGMPAGWMMRPPQRPWATRRPLRRSWGGCTGPGGAGCGGRAGSFCCWRSSCGSCACGSMASASSRPGCTTCRRCRRGLRRAIHSPAALRREACPYRRCGIRRAQRIWDTTALLSRWPGWSSGPARPRMRAARCAGSPAAACGSACGRTPGSSGPSAPDGS